MKSSEAKELMRSLKMVTPSGNITKMAFYTQNSMSYIKVDADEEEEREHTDEHD